MRPPLSWTRRLDPKAAWIADPSHGLRRATLICFCNLQAIPSTAAVENQSMNPQFLLVIPKLNGLGYVDELSSPLSVQFHSDSYPYIVGDIILCVYIIIYIHIQIVWNQVFVVNHTISHTFTYYIVGTIHVISRTICFAPAQTPNVNLGRLSEAHLAEKINVYSAEITVMLKRPVSF